MRTSPIATAAALLLSAAASQAAIAVFDFEGAPATGFTGGYTALSLTDGGLTMLVTRPPTVFDVVLNIGGQAGKPASWGLHSLHGFADGSPIPFILNFSTAVTGVSIEFGDYGADFPDILHMAAYSGLGGSGTLLATDSVPFLAATFPAFATGLVSAGGIMSVVMLGGSAAFPSSVFYDNIHVEYAIPEPSTYALMGLGLLMAGAVARRRARKD